MRSTLAQWVGECGVQLQPLVDTLTAERCATADSQARHEARRAARPLADALHQ
jgi:hypothetical protein